MNYSALFVLNMDLVGVNDGKNAWLLDRNGWEIDGLDFELGLGNILILNKSDLFEKSSNALFHTKNKEPIFSQLVQPASKAICTCSEV